MAAFHVFRLHENAGRWSKSDVFSSSRATNQQPMQGKLYQTPPLFAPISPFVPIHLQSPPNEGVSSTTRATTQQSMQGKLVLVPSPSLFAPIAPVVQTPFQPAPTERVSLTRATTQQKIQGKFQQSSPLIAPIAPMVPTAPQSAPPERVSTAAGNPPLFPKRCLQLSPSKPKRRGRKPRSRDIAPPTAKSLFAPLVPARRSSRLLSNQATSCDVPTPVTSITKPERLVTRASKIMNISAGIKKKRGRPPKSAMSATSAAPPKSAAPGKSTPPDKAKTQEGEVVVETFWHRDKQVQRAIGKKSAFQRKWISQNEAVAGKVAKLQRDRAAKMRGEVK